MFIKSHVPVAWIEWGISERPLYRIPSPSESGTAPACDILPCFVSWLQLREQISFLCYILINSLNLWFLVACCIWAILPERVHHWRNILSCTAKTSKHMIKNNIFDKLNRFLRYHHIKMRQWWNAEFHRFCILIWWYLKNIFSLSRTFCWAKLGQSVWLNCPIFLLAKCLLDSAMQDKMWHKKWKLLRENCPNS